MDESEQSDLFQLMKRLQNLTLLVQNGFNYIEKRVDQLHVDVKMIKEALKIKSLVKLDASPFGIHSPQQQHEDSSQSSCYSTCTQD
jgi:hypothetical protein